jgi:hypothetical protein
MSENFDLKSEVVQSYIVHGLLPQAQALKAEAAACRKSQMEAKRRRRAARAARNAEGLIPMKPEFGSTRPG